MRSVRCRVSPRRRLRRGPGPSDPRSGTRGGYVLLLAGETRWTRTTLEVGCRSAEVGNLWVTLPEVGAVIESWTVAVCTPQGRPVSSGSPGVSVRVGGSLPGVLFVGERTLNLRHRVKP